MASGKSTLAKKKAKEENKKLVSIDEEIEKDHNMPISEIFKRFGENYFRDKEREKLIEVYSQGEQIVDCGGGAPIFNPELIQDNSYVIFVDTDFETIWERLQEDTSRPLAQNKTKEELKELYDKRVKLYRRICNETVKS
jgi:shikimate kinase